MPFVPSQHEYKGPDGAHLCLMAGDGRMIGIPPGASLWLVEDKTQQDKIFPLVLKKVSVKKLTFVLMMADGSSTEYVYQLTTAKPLSRAAHQRLLANRSGLPVVHQR